jgi:hypothetical protein
MQKGTPRSRKASGSVGRSGGEAARPAVASTCGSVGSCLINVYEAERQLVAQLDRQNFFVNPAVLDSRDLVESSPPGWARELAFDQSTTAQVGLKFELPETGQLRARKLISRSRRVMTGKYPSWKLGRLVHWESRLESSVFRLLDVCPAVKAFAEQPLTIHYLDAGKWHAHVPDVAYVTAAGKVWILEVKSSMDRGVADARRRAALIAPRLKVLGIGYAIAAEESIRAGTSLSNAEALVKGARGASSARADHDLRSLVEERLSISQAELVGLVFDMKRAFHVAAGLVMRGGLSLNWMQANTEEMAIQRLTNTNQEESLLWLQRALGVIR